MYRPSSSPAAIDLVRLRDGQDPLHALRVSPSAPEQPASGTRPVRRLPVLRVTALLEQQRSLTLVEKFAEHDARSTPQGERFYRDLVPLSQPGPGEQYAFKVDLDACTGCKACVAACHALNGLDEGEVFRSTGLLQGVAAGSTATQTLTSSCHHCLDPACLTGCPVGAYEKDPLTGIVKHLDDQCFGCQYCTLMCPYDAPKYNAKKGIVRKCDMCSERLTHGQAPACVDACPSGAIAIVNVAREAIESRARAGVFVPGVAPPAHTLPTTEYTSRSSLARFSAAGEAPAEPQPVHASLVSMLTLTQLAAGMALLGPPFEAALGAENAPRLASALAVAACAGTGVVASLFHLGRPWLAHRAVLGLKTSWLSREAVALGAFAMLATGSAVASVPRAAIGWAPSPGGAGALALQLATLLTGLVGVWCSVMVYAVTRRPHWALRRTALRFLPGTLLLGAGALLVLYRCGASLAGTPERGPATIVLTLLVLLATGARLAQGRGAHGGALQGWMGLRNGAWLLGAALPVLSALPVPTSARLLGSVVGFALVACAELLDRCLFFAAAPSARLPGSVR